MIKHLILIGLGALALAGCVTKGKYEAQINKYKKLQMEKTTLEQARESLKKELELKSADNRRLGGELGDWKEKHARVSGEAGELKDQLEATKEELEELRRARAEAEERMKSLRIMEEKFRKLIDSGNLEVVNFNGRLVIKLKANILFDAGKAKVREEGITALKDVAGVLAQFTGRHFQVSGHTDDEPVKRSGWQDNWELSSVRAVAVLRVLQDAGVPPGMLSAAGYSEFQPVKTNDSEENKKFNRRIEITIMPEIPKM